MKFCVTVFIVLFSSGIIMANTILVPSQYPNIQAGINAAQNGDTVLVADGTYSGMGNYNLGFGGRLIVVMSENGYANCTIDCQYSGRGFYFHSGETNSAVLKGFSIINGASSTGGGIECSNSNPTITECYISNCNAGNGGGMYITNCNGLRVTDCIICNNSSTNT